MLRILIAEAVPSPNKGELAILYGLRECLKTIGDYKLSIFSFRPQYDQERYGDSVEVLDVAASWPLMRTAESGLRIIPSLWVMLQHLLFAISTRLLGRRTLRVWRGEVWRSYLDADLIILGHDSSFGIGGEPENPLLYPLYMPMIARQLGKPTIFFAGTVPTLPRRFRALFARLYRCALEQMDEVTLREEASQANVRALGLNDPRITVTADVAYLMPPCSEERVKELFFLLQLPMNQEPLVGVTISRVRGSVAYPALDDPELSYRRHLEMISETIDGIVERLGATVVFLPHCVGFGERNDDRVTAREIRKLCRSKESVKIIDTELSPMELKGIIGRFDLFLGERLHSVIAAASMGVPSIALSYSKDPRLGMVRPIVTDAYICQLEGLTVEGLLTKVCALWEGRFEVAAALRSRSEIIRARARMNGERLEGLLERRRQEKSSCRFYSADACLR